MTISTLIGKLKRYWYILVILPILFSLFGFSSYNNKTEYKASIGLGYTFNSPDYSKVSSDNYDRAINSGGEYLANRFKSVEIQKRIVSEMGIGDSRIDAKKPFYEIANQQAGFVNVLATFGSDTEANNFLNAVKKTYIELLQTEKNFNESSPYKIKPMENFLQSVVKTTTPIQFQILPTIFGLLLGILVALLLPAKKQKLLTSGEMESTR
jgi:capsular polysaccharide biosynthesis protein